MKKIYLLGFFFLNASLGLFAQKEDYQFVCGSGYMLTDSMHPIFGCTLFDFNRNPVNHHYTYASLNFNAAYAGICHGQTGKLLFYTNGIWLMDKTGEMMQNGDSINF
ncbi:MAG: hypothetical protein RI894_901, partial [Bacteroidota bacterium]